MQKKALLALMLVLVLILSGCSLVKKDEAVDRATPIVSLGDKVYTKGEVIDSVNYNLSYTQQLYSYFGMSYDITDETIAETKDNVVNSMTEQVAKVWKANQLGLDQFTDADREQIASATDAEWTSNLEQIRSYYFTDTTLTGDELTAALESSATDLGVTRESIEKSVTEDLLVEKVKDLTVADVAIDDSDLQAALDEKAESAKSSYESSPSSYGTAVNGGSTVYYRPAGYRIVKQILVKYTEADQAVIDDLTARASDATSKVTELTDSLSAVASDTDLLLQKVTTAESDALLTASVTDLASTTDLFTVIAADFADDVIEETADLTRQLAVAKAENEYLENALNEAVEKAYADIDARADEVLAQIAEGGDWEALTAEYNEDPGMMADAATAKTGYAVMSGMSGMDAAFTEAAMALENVGDVTGKVRGSYGYYIIKYESDVEEGPVALDDVRGALYDDTLTAKQDAYFEEQVQAWIKECGVKVDRKALDD